MQEMLAHAALGALLGAIAGSFGALFGWWLLFFAALDLERHWRPDALTLPLVPAGLAASLIPGPTDGLQLARKVHEDRPDRAGATENAQRSAGSVMQ